MTTLLSARDVRALADELDLRPTKQRGQNFVIDPNTVRMIVQAADLGDAPRTVAEIGPGLGSLTLGLLEAGHHVVAVEIDPVLAGRLPRTVAELHGDTTVRGGTAPEAPAADGAPRQGASAAGFDLVHADAMDVTELPAAPSALVANLPYNVAVPVLLHFLATFPTIDTVLVMVQLEVADRLAAAPGSRVYGVPSVKAQWYGEVTRAATIGKNVFWPAPNIDSGLVKIVLRETPLGDEDLRVRVFSLVDAAFAQRRKMLRSALKDRFGSAAAASEALAAAGIDPQARGETLTVHDFVRLAEVTVS
ncbi:16S rRNA (adenine(1518)-N(6)/adenine(1519)-N(6))-dimethyltransferase RsmA [Brevibacterium litoralis]|uniref:16S rRNA (adenine(1518)-N(6)/adenine(1519)-N(6))- dimethyltransferase RsmA n=1 Tax=Brevibacterium litoralis TaxID=3138935 RepID=UPI0032ECA95A